MFAVGCDSDGDGVSNGDDCAPDNADIHPDADEICDGIDNNCDGVVDEGVTTTFYVDADGDGFGGVQTVDACEAPAGFLEDNTDCDDLNAAAYPGAAEVCDDVDNNCDGLVDDDDPANDASTGHTFYADADGDGYGDAASTLDSCSTPDGYVDNADDCDDTDAQTSPDTNWYGDQDGDGYGDSLYITQSCEAVDGYSREDGDCDDLDGAISPAADEYCDGIDNNCDGTVDEDSAVDALTWFEDADTDGYGSTVTTVACYLPDGYVDVDGDCDDAEAAVNPGATEVCGDSLDNDCDGTTDYAVSVPTDYPTIQAAIDAASDGDGICIEAGTYTENLELSVGVTLAGSGEGTTILDGGGNQLFDSSWGYTTAVRHMTLQNSYDSYGGVFYGYGGDASFENVTLVDVGCSGSGSCYGGGFLTEYGALTLRNVTADGLDIESGYYLYGGLVRSYESDLVIDQVDFTSNYVAGGSSGYMYGMVVYAYESTVDIQELNVTDNWFLSQYFMYGLIYTTGSTETTVNDSHFDANVIESEGYTYADAGYPFVYQSGSYSTSTWDNVTWSDNEINSKDDVWAWFYFSASNGSAEFTNVIVSDNAAANVNGNGSSNGAYGMMYNYNTEVTFTNADFVNNSWTDFDYVYGQLGYRSYGGDYDFVNTNLVNSTLNNSTAYAGILYTSYSNSDGVGEFSWNYSNRDGNWDTYAYYDWYDDGFDGDFSGFTGNLADDPLYTDAANGDYTLTSSSTLIDAGDPEILDADGSTSDIGAYGGPGANL